MRSRRLCLTGSLIIGLLLGACSSTKAAPSIVSGPMNGYATPTEVGLWARLSEPAKVRIRYWNKENLQEKGSLQTESGGLDGRTLSAQLSGLTPGQRFHYEFDLQVGTKWVKAPLDRPLEFQTQSLWRRRTAPPNFSFALGSCAYINDPPFDATNGPPYGGGYEIFDVIADTKPDFMLWLGDAVYLRSADWGSARGIHYRYAHARRLPGLQRLLGATHHYATWDDHDYGPNDADWTYVHKGSALRTFQEFWMNPSYGLPDTPGVFTQFSWSDVDFFLLDNRYYRSSSNAPDGHDKTQLGDVQLRWLLDALSTSRATFKIVAGGGQFLSPFDRWEGYAQFAYERDHLIDELRRRKVEGLIFLSGDRHHSELVRIEPVGSYPLYDFTSSPLTSRGASAEGELQSPVRVDGTLVNNQHNFGMLHFTGEGEKRMVTLETRDAKGKILWSHAIRAAQLRYAESK